MDVTVSKRPAVMNAKEVMEDNESGPSLLAPRATPRITIGSDLNPDPSSRSAQFLISRSAADHWTASEMPALSPRCVCSDRT